MEQMSPLDAAFWELEDPQCGLHVGSLAVFLGPAPTLDEVLNLYHHKLHLVPRLRQRMRRLPALVGRPVWVDDTGFELRHHVHGTVVPSPGGTRELLALMGRIMSTHLDPERPLWEAWLVRGLAGGQWAIITKLHHSMVDGLAGMSVLNRIFDTDPNAALPPRDRWTAMPESTARLITATLLGQLRGVGRTTRRLAVLAGHPRRTSQQVLLLGNGVRTYAGALRPGPRTRLTGRLGASRGYCATTLSIADLAAIKDCYGATLNDVVLALATTGLRDLLIARGEPPAPNLVRCLVPVSVRPPADTTVNNQVSAMLVELPVEFADPVDRLRALVARTRRIKASPEAAAGAALTSLACWAPPQLVTMGVHTAARIPQSAVTTVVTNVPGAPGRRYLLGRRMLAHYPYVPIADRIRIGIAVTSYDEQIYVGITCDRDSVPDVAVLRAGIERGLDKLTDTLQNTVRRIGP